MTVTHFSQTDVVEISPPPGECIRWPGAIDTWGYGMKGRSGRAHRLAYIDARGSIPDGMVIDHLCHSASPDCRGGRSCPHRSCVNIDHLEAITPEENSRRTVRTRQTHCRQGHPYDEANTYLGGEGRVCRACNREAVRRYKTRKMLRAAGVVERAA